MEQGALEPWLDDENYDEMDISAKTTNGHKKDDKTKYQMAWIYDAVHNATQHIHNVQADMCEKQTK